MSSLWIVFNLCPVCGSYLICVQSVARPAVFKADRPLVFAHRGGARLAPENTLAAIDNGLSLGSDGVEVDVHLSSDGIPVVIHDPTLDRTTNRTGPVEALSAAELARVDAGFRFELDGGFPFRGLGIGIPTLDAVLAKHQAARVIIEMKGGEPELARAVAGAVMKAGAVDRVCVSSFQQTSVDTIRAEHPRSPRAHRCAKRAGPCTDRGCGGRGSVSSPIAPSKCRFLFFARASLLVFSSFHRGSDRSLQRNRPSIDSCLSGEKVARLRNLFKAHSGGRT